MIKFNYYIIKYDDIIIKYINAISIIKKKKRKKIKIKIIIKNKRRLLFRDEGGAKSQDKIISLLLHYIYMYFGGRRNRNRDGNIIRVNINYFFLVVCLLKKINTEKTKI
jgi:hypothetical protein